MKIQLHALILQFVSFSIDMSILISYLLHFVPPQFVSHSQSEHSSLGVPWPLQSILQSAVIRNTILRVGVFELQH